MTPESQAEFSVILLSTDGLILGWRWLSGASDGRTSAQGRVAGTARFDIWANATPSPSVRFHDDIAEATGRKVDLLLYRLKQRLIEIPSGVSVVDFIQFDGKPAAPDSRRSTRSGEFRDKYLATHKSSLEKTTLDGIELHFGYFVEAWGEKFPINDLSLLKLQEYVEARTKDAGMNGRKVSAATIKKEIVTLRTAWNWAKRAKIVKEPFPYAGLRYPRTTEKPPVHDQGRD